jgi:hypothetical protein
LLVCTAGCPRNVEQSSPAPGDAAYALTAGDTLRYRVRSEWSATYGLAGMPQAGGTRYRRDARLAIAFTGGGRARAWFESVRLEIRDQGSRPEVRVAGAEVVGMPFLLAVGPRGSDSVLSRPPLPPQWSDVGDQLGGFLPRLPGGPLPAGREWSDTGTNNEVEGHMVTSNSRDVTYRVGGTERIRGVPVVVVTYEATYQSTTRSTASPPPGMDPYLMPSMVSYIETRARGTYYFAPRSGRLVRHSWTSERYFSRPSGHVEAATQSTIVRVTIDLVSRLRE